MALPGWSTRSLLNREDPVGLVNQDPPHLLIISDDFGRQKDLGIVRAIQRYRPQGMRVIGVLEDLGAAMEHADLFDAAVAPPWTAADLRRLAQEQYTALTGQSVAGTVDTLTEDG